MDETDFSEDTTYKQQEDLPYDDTVSQKKMFNDGNFTSKNNILGVSDQVIPTEDGPLEKAAHEIYPNTAVAMTWEKITKNDFLVDKKGDKEKQCFMTLYIPADEGDTLKSNISDILLHHLSKDQFLGSQGIDCKTLPEISHAYSTDEAAIITNISSYYVKNFWSKEKTPESLHQLDPKRDGENSNKPNCSPSSSDLEEQVATGNQENSKILTKITGLSDKQKSCQPQEPQKQLTEKASLSNVFKYSQGQVHYQLPDFSKVAPKVKIPKNNLISKSLTMAKQASSSPKLRNKSTIVEDILENLSRSNCVEKQRPEKKRKITETSQQIQMESAVHIHQELLTGLESETSPLKLTSAFQKDLSSSSSSVFQKICQGKQMCQKLKEQTEQLKTKVQEFSKRIQQDSLCHLQDRQLVLEQLQGHPQVLERDFVATKETHLALQQQIHSMNPQLLVTLIQKEVEGEIFKLEMLLEDVKEKIDESKYTSILSLPVNSPTIPDDLASTFSSSSNEEDPSGAPGAQERAETAAPSPGCAFCRRLLRRKQKMERKGLRRINCGRFSIVIHEKAPHQDSALGFDTRSSSSDSSSGRQHNKCEHCGTETQNSRRDCSKDPLEEFHYRYNTPGQYYLNHSRRDAFVQSCSLDENKNSAPSCSKPKQLCSQRVNSQSFQDECEPMLGERDLKTFMTCSADSAILLPHFQSCKISGSKSLCDFNSIEKTESKILNSALDRALKTATILKQTTDQMIKVITEDLAKAQRWRNRLKY